MITMTVVEFSKYLDVVVKEFHKNYSCLVFTCEQSEECDHNKEDLSKYFTSILFSRKNKENERIYVSLGRHGVRSRSFYGNPPTDDNPYKLTIKNIISNENELSYDFNNHGNDVRFYAVDSKLKGEEVKVTFDPEFIKGEIKKIIFDMEMKD